jgi:ABC-2 type transport system permease protein
MITIFKKELYSYLSSFVAYITIGLFLVVLGLFLWVFPDTSILEYGYATLDNLFNTVPYLLRSLAEEKKEGTFELLATRPLTDWDIVLGKYLAALTLVLFALIPTLIYYISVYQLGVTVGNIDTGAVIGSYIGLFLLGGAFAAIGIFSSSLTKNQIIAFAIAVFLCFFAFSGFESASQVLSLQKFDNVLINLGINEHYQSISRGVLDSRDLIYFLSFITLFLLITKTILGGRKW